MIIYCFTHRESGKKYVGLSTKEDLKKILVRHKNASFLLGRAMRKYGVEAFSVEVIDRANDLEELRSKEIFWINKLGTKYPGGFNLSDGGDVTRKDHYEISDITRIALGKANSSLSDEDVRNIRSSSEPQKILAERYGIQQSAVSKIRRGLTWKHLLTA